MSRIPQCQRRVAQVRCSVMGADFCKTHSPIQCTVCNNQTAVFECVTCQTPICPSCQHHDSFGK